MFPRLLEQQQNSLKYFWLCEGLYNIKGIVYIHSNIMLGLIVPLRLVISL